MYFLGVNKKGWSHCIKTEKYYRNSSSKVVEKVFRYFDQNWLHPLLGENTEEQNAYSLWQTHTAYFWVKAKRGGVSALRQSTQPLWQILTPPLFVWKQNGPESLYEDSILPLMETERIHPLLGENKQRKSQCVRTKSFFTLTETDSAPLGENNQDLLQFIQNEDWGTSYLLLIIGFQNHKRWFSLYLLYFLL